MRSEVYEQFLEGLTTDYAPLERIMEDPAITQALDDIEEAVKRIEAEHIAKNKRLYEASELAHDIQYIFYSMSDDMSFEEAIELTRDDLINKNGEYTLEFLLDQLTYFDADDDADNFFATSRLISRTRSFQK